MIAVPGTFLRMVGVGDRTFLILAWSSVREFAVDIATVTEPMRVVRFDEDD